MNNCLRTIMALLAVGLAASRADAQRTVVGSPHDLSVLGPGEIHAVEQEQVCIFCHAPHNTTGFTKAPPPTPASISPAVHPRCA
ncbi:MAG: hypothetical protein ACE5GE_07630 [Phycisphaerae bacterium]